MTAVKTLGQVLSEQAGDECAFGGSTRRISVLLVSSRSDMLTTLVVAQALGEHFYRNGEIDAWKRMVDLADGLEQLLRRDDPLSLGASNAFVDERNDAINQLAFITPPYRKDD